MFFFIIILSCLIFLMFYVIPRVYLTTKALGVCQFHRSIESIIYKSYAGHRANFFPAQSHQTYISHMLATEQFLVSFTRHQTEP